VFSVAEKLALIYTLAGSMRRVASFVGVTHQRVSRAMQGQAGAQALANLAPLVDAIWPAYVDVARDQALADGLPFDPRIPVTYRRLARQDGLPGDRIAAEHTHWLPDTLRDKWIVAMQKSGRFYAASVESIVNLVVYFKRGEQIYRGKRDERKRANRNSLLRKMALQTESGRRAHQVAVNLEQQAKRQYGKVPRDVHRQIWGAFYQTAEKLYGKLVGAEVTINGPVFTAYTPMSANAPSDLILNDIKNKMADKHEPLTGQDHPGTVLFSSVLLQVDTRNGKDSKFRRQHPYPNRDKARKR
jgi:hypothetical protein